MNERQKIEESLIKKEKEIQSLEDKIKAAKVYVKALRDILKLIDKETDSESAEITLRQGSAVAAARNIILKRQSPMHIGDLLEAMGKNSTRETRSSLASSLAAYVRRGDIFVRTAPNTFGLIELGHWGNEETPEPPSGFGQIDPPSPSPVTDDDEIPF